MCKVWIVSSAFRSKPLIRDQQCGQRPVYKNHEFCGKNCANNWQAMYGSTGTNSYGPTSSYGPASYGSSQPQYGQGQSSYTTQPKTQYPPGSPSRSYQSLGQGNVRESLRRRSTTPPKKT